jgi:RimJ/RimL family protein N-acetyltransferase
VVLGEAGLWGIDVHNRSAHLGIGLLPEARGRGLGVATVELLCEYGFAVLGLNRIQIDTLTENEPMLRTAAACGFTLEGRIRQAAWTRGRFSDEAVLGLLADEWRQRDGLDRVAAGRARGGRGPGRG